MTNMLLTNMLFSTPKYQKEILIEPLLLNKADVIKLLIGGLEKGVSHSHAFNQDVNLVVRLKNTGNKGAWGTLVCHVEGYREVPVQVLHLTPNMREFVNFVIPLSGMITLVISPSGMITPLSGDNPLTIETKWRNLYSK